MQLDRGLPPPSPSSAALVAALVVLLLDVAARAQQPGGFTMPLPSPDLPDGVLTVKVVGNGMEDRKVDQPVTLLKTSSAAPEPVQTVKTGEDGRARFERLDRSARYLVRVEVDGQSLESSPFAGPPKGGLRLLLTLGGGSPMPSSQPSQPGAMPPGHPPTGGEPGAAGGPGQGSAAKIEAADQLERGEILIRVSRGDPPAPVSGAMVIAPWLASGAHAKTDPEGKALLRAGDAKAPLGMVSVVHDGISYRSDPLQLPEKGGLEITFTVYDRSLDLHALRILEGSHLVLQPGEDVVSVMEVLKVQNTSTKLVDAGAAGLEFSLPRGARGPEVPEEQKDLMAADTEQNKIRVTSPLPPGPTVLRLFFELPYKGAEAELRQKLPLAAQGLMAIVNGRARLEVFGPSVKGPDPDSRERFVLDAIAAGGELELTIGGLPHRDRRPAAIALLLAVLLMLWAGWAAWTGPRQVHLREERQESLLQQLVQLQRSKHRGESVAQRRRELIRELSAVWEEPEAR